MIVTDSPYLNPVLGAELAHLRTEREKTQRILVQDENNSQKKGFPYHGFVLL